jgi:hypothetical protein
MPWHRMVFRPARLGKSTRRHAHHFDPRPVPSGVIAMSQSDLARAAAVPVALVKGFEMGILTLRPPDLDAIQQALERAGIQFIEGDRPGLRSRK